MATVLAAVPALALLLWLKIRLFRGLEYTSDLISAVQASRSWLAGRPLLHDNYWGDLTAIHNYYLTPLLGPLTWWAGVYGLFVGHAALILLAWIETIRSFADSRWPRLVASFAFLFGPISVWIWDNPTYGWHAELLFLPLSVLFVGSLRRHSRAVWLWGGLLVLVHEEGAVLACSLHLLAVWTENAEPLASRRNLRVTAKIATAWALVFFAGLLLQRFNAPPTSTRLVSAFARLFEAPDARTLLFDTGVTRAVVLFAAGILMVAPRRSRDALLAFVVALPLLGVILVGSAAYEFNSGGAGIHGATWPPRFVLLWSVIGSLLLAAPSWLDEPAIRLRRFACLVALAAIALQPALLREFRDYDPGARVQSLWRDDVLVGDRLGTGERELLDCLAERLPTNTSVTAHGSLFAYFHRHDLVWPNRLDKAWQMPLVVACDLGERLPYEYGCLALANVFANAGFRTMRRSLVGVAYDSTMASTIAACAAPPLARSSVPGASP